MKTWLIDTALFKHLAPGGQQKPDLANWIKAHSDPIFLSAASIVELAAAIERIPAHQGERAKVLAGWLDNLVTNFADRIRPVDVSVARRAGELMPRWKGGRVEYRLHDLLLVATAQIYGHGLLTKREPVFGPWTKIEVEVV